MPRRTIRLSVDAEERLQSTMRATLIRGLSLERRWTTNWREETILGLRDNLPRAWTRSAGRSFGLVEHSKPCSRWWTVYVALQKASTGGIPSIGPPAVAWPLKRSTVKSVQASFWERHAVWFPLHSRWCSQESLSLSACRKRRLRYQRLAGGARSVNPGIPAEAKPRSTILPVILAVKIWPRPM